MKFSIEKCTLVIYLISFVFFIIPYGNMELQGANFDVLSLIFIFSIFCSYHNTKFKNIFLSIFNLFFYFFYLAHVWLFKFSLSYFDPIILASQLEMRSAIWDILFQYIAFSLAIILIKPVLYFKKVHLSTKNKFTIFFSCIFVLILNSLHTKFGSSGNNFFEILFTLIPHWDVLFFICLLQCSTSQSRFDNFIKYFLILFYFLSAIFWGTKAGGLYILIYCFLFYKLIKREAITITLKSSINVFFVMALIISSSFVSKSFYQYRESLAVGSNRPIITNLESDLSRSLSENLRVVSSRCNYLNIYLVRTSQLKVLKSKVTLEAYILAIIDRLSPGFSFFGNSPYVSRIIYSLHSDNNKIMGSELMTLFFESRLIFSNAYFVFFIFIIGFINFLSLKNKECGPMSNFIFNILILHIFYNLIEGFGLDMLVCESIYKFVGILLIFFLARRLCQTKSKKFFI